jgi:hypothetical protein
LELIDVDTNQERITELFTDVQRKKYKIIQVHIDSREKNREKRQKKTGQERYNCSAADS